MQNGFTLVVGGAASGKSRHAEALVCAVQRPKVYVATAQAFDTEMAAKIAAHQSDRGAGWRTIEAPTDLVSALEMVAPDEAVLIDCATLWLTNLILADMGWQAEADRLLSRLSASVMPVVIVSNEVGAGIVPENKLSRRFREAQGRLNQRLAAAATRVDTVIAGLPLTLKGGA